VAPKTILSILVDSRSDVGTCNVVDQHTGPMLPVRRILQATVVGMFCSERIVIYFLAAASGWSLTLQADWLPTSYYSGAGKRD
jgi:hypothetical protein